ncbi:hypothetical protein CBW65_22160 [Tumebacillus avium]|uniref:DUF502 domain-containing protein n=1 Tax=Tumebacillus avium TaxID=1903704 RepID=A0A1Y0IRX4_9BACL|nr:DUF502 domain-containing protein [Tumebacillus avium]ARU63392.1 hypothetical protein CBW65_22160 [Tumebacillus avium]
MWRSLLKFFMNGILTIVPIGLVVYVVVQSFQFLDSLLGNTLRAKIGDVYVPGFGILLTLVLITLVGWLTTHWFSAQLIGIVESILQRIPFVKTLYKVIRETIESFVGEKKSFSKVALVTLPNNPMKMLGFVTTENVAKLSDKLADHIAIYVPQTFQVAGVTFLVPKEHVQILDVPPEEAMRFILSGGVSGS